MGNATILRIIGDVFVAKTVAIAQGTTDLVVFGIVIISRVSFGAGSFPVPSTDQADWIWHQHVLVPSFDEIGTANNAMLAIPQVHIHFDVKGKRKIHELEEIPVLVRENVSGNTDAATMAAAGRMLILRK